MRWTRHSSAREVRVASSSVRHIVRVGPLERSASGTILGVIYLDLDTRAFPDAQWSDFPVVILAWWIDAVGPLLSGPTRSTELRFMDGPFWVEVAPKPNR